MPLTTTQKNDRLFKLAATKLALFPGAFDRFMLYVAAGLKVRDTFEVHQALNQKIADFITADGQLLSPEAAELVAFDRWSRELVDRWFHENVNPFPPVNDAPYQPAPRTAPARHTPPHPAITTAPAQQPAPAPRKAREDALAPLMRKAMADASDPDSAVEVFTILKTWAQEKPPRPPLIGLSNDGASITWESAAGEFEQTDLRAVRMRLYRSKKARQGTARNGKAR